MTENQELGWNDVTAALIICHPDARNDRAQLYLDPDVQGAIMDAPSAPRQATLEYWIGVTGACEAHLKGELPSFRGPDEVQAYMRLQVDSILTEANRRSDTDRLRMDQFTNDRLRDTCSRSRK